MWLSGPGQRRLKLHQTDGASDKDLWVARYLAQIDLSVNKKGFQAQLNPGAQMVLSAIWPPP